MTAELNDVIRGALDNLKGQNCISLDVVGLSDITDTMIVISGTSDRHVKSLAANVIDAGKHQGYRPISVEGIEAGDWVLIDYGDTIVHVMLPQTRSFYDLESLWWPMASSPTDEK